MSQIISINPSSLEEIGRLEATSEQQVKEFVSKARAAFPYWSRLSYKERAAYILRARDYLLKNIDAFAETITKDNGKPITESLSAEIFPIADLLYWAANNAEKILKRKRIGIGVFDLMLRRSYIGYQPLGVIGIISPWNYPFSIPVGTIAMALMAGNCVVHKPSSATPLVGEKIAELFAAAGLPEFVFTNIQGGGEIGEALLNCRLDKVVFTGSVGIGRHVAEVCAKKLVPCVLELGGKDPCIVRADADLDHASSGVVWGAFTNAGQCCASIERVYVHESIADKFINLVVEKTKKLRMGIDVGPMTTKGQLEIVEKQVEEAKARGAKILTAPSPLVGEGRGEGFFFPPTVITGVDHTFSCVAEETFGPLLPIMTYSNDQQAIQLANDSEYGLNAYIWTKDIKTGQQMAEQLRAGTVAINECVYTHAIPQTPWGGVKHSGFGRTHSAHGFYEMVNLHHIHINPITFIKDFWWYPYGDKLAKAIKGLANTLTSDVFTKIKAVPHFLKCLIRKKN